MADEDPVDETQDDSFELPKPPTREELEALPQRIRVGDDPDDGGDEFDSDQAGDGGDEEPETVELTPEERRQFRSLLTIGKRSKTISIFDHSVVIRSLNCDDEIRVGMKTRDHRESTGFSRVYQCAVVAAAIESVDGEPWGVGLTSQPDPDAQFERKFTRVAELHPMVVQMIYTEINGFDLEFAELAAKLGKL